MKRRPPFALTDTKRAPLVFRTTWPVSLAHDAPAAPLGATAQRPRMTRATTGPVRMGGTLAVGVHGLVSPAASRPDSSEPLCQPDDDALGAAHEAEPVDVLVLRDLVEQLGPVVAAKPVDDVVD